jgi:hypothetical protein
MNEIKVIDELKTEQFSKNPRNYPSFYELNMTRKVEYNGDIYDVTVYYTIVETLCDVKHRFAEIKINKNNNFWINVVIDIYWNDYSQSYNDDIVPVFTECKENVLYSDFQKIVGINFYDGDFDIEEEFNKDMEFNRSNDYKQRLKN